MTVRLALWVVATGLHAAFIDRAVRRARPFAGSLDERLFAAALASVASLSLVLHVVSVTVGLGLVTGLAGLSVWHLGLWWLTSRPVAVGDTAPSEPVSAVEALALGLVAAVVLSWVVLSARSPNIDGPDAAHYHVPFAVNLAAGASVFDLPATPHLYPMAGSMVAAWFIVPVGDPQLVDLAMVAPWLLLVASLNMLFRCATGRSGLAWGTWLALALFSTPMFRSVSEGAADLWFAAGFVALLATLMVVWWRRRVSRLDLVLAGGAAGLLLGSKITGLPAAVILVGGAAALEGLRRALGGERLAWPHGSIRIALVAAVVCVGAGGIWLVRNWVQFGSPVAPANLSFESLTTLIGGSEQAANLSIAAELQTDTFRLWPTVTYYVRQWFGTYYLAALWPIVLLVVDLAGGVRRRHESVWWPRFALLALTLLAGVLLSWMLVGAPYTAFGRNRGYALRYVLPVAALLPLASAIACFPVWLPRWDDRVSARTAVGAAVSVGAVWLVWHSPWTGPAVPRLDGIWLAANLPVAWLAQAKANRSVRVARATVAIGLIAFVAWWAPMAAAGAASARAQRQADLDTELQAAAAGLPIGDTWREPFVAVRAAEAAAGARCGHRRFYALTRFDEPLALQPPDFTSTVYYAGRDVEAARRAGPVTSCDYVITTAELQATAKGRALEAALAGPGRLQPVARGRAWIVLTSASK